MPTPFQGHSICLQSPSGMLTAAVIRSYMGSWTPSLPKGSGTFIAGGKSNFRYRKFPKYSDTPKICCNHSKIWTMWLYRRVMNPNDAGGMPNSVDLDQTAPLGAVWFGSALFAQAYLSENLGSLWYCKCSSECSWSGSLCLLDASLW